MPVENPTFEAAGVSPGEAAGWTLTASSGLHIVAGFGAPAGGEQAWERFERPLVTSLDGFVQAIADFGEDAVRFEDFSGRLFWELPVGRTVTAVFHGELVEDMYAMGSLGSDFEELPTTAASFGGEPIERFAEGPYVWTLDDFVTTAAGFDGDVVETFDDEL